MAKDGHWEDGAKFRISLVNQGIIFYEKSVQIRGEEGGDPIDITTNDNTSRRSFAPPTYTAPTPGQSSVTYDKADYAAIKAAVDVSDQILVTYPDDSTEDAEPGWLRSFIPDTAEQAAQPVATVIFEYEGEAPV